MSLQSCNSYQSIDKFKYGQKMQLFGVVSSIPKIDGKVVEFVFHTVKYGDVMLKADKKFINYLVPGNKFRLMVKLYKLNEYDNVAAFNYVQYLEHKKIVAIGQVEKDSNLMATGTSHLMVISGLHVGLVAFILFMLFRFTWSLFPRLCRKVPAQYIGFIGSVFMILIYSFLVGFSLPTQRAMIMLIVVIIFFLLKHRISALKILVISLIMIIVLDPKSVYSFSLWLSFFAVALLIIIGVLFQSNRSNWKMMLVTQVYLAIFLIPISVYYFDGFSIAAIFANIVAIPLISFVIVPLLFLSLGFSFIGIKIWSIPIFFLKGLYLYLEFLSKHLLFVEYWGVLPFFSLLVVVVGILLFVFPFNLSVRILGLTMCLVFFQLPENLSQKFNRSEIQVFDTPNQIVLIQVQGKSIIYASVKALSNEYTLVNILKKYLKVVGISQIDYLVVSGNKSEKLDLEFIRHIVPIDQVITNLQVDTIRRKCSYENNLSFNHVAMKFLSDSSHCFVSLRLKSKEVLLMDNSSMKVQRLIYTLYNKTISPAIIIAPAKVYSKFIHASTDYMIYTSNKPITNVNISDKLKIFDTYSNGAIAVSFYDKGNLRVSSQLKRY